MTHTTHHFGSEAAIATLDVKRNQHGEWQAILYPADGRAPSDAMRQLPTLLARAGMANAYADVVSGKNGLVIPRITAIEPLLALLKEQALIPQHAHIDAASLPEPPQFLDVMRNRAVKIAGFVCIPGQVAIAADGILKRDLALATMALSAANPLIMSLYGRAPEERWLHQVHTSMRDALAKAQMDVAPLMDDEPASLLEHVQRYVHDHPQQVGFGFSFISGLGFLGNSMRTLQQTGKWTRAAIASTSTLGSAVVMLVPQKDNTASEAKEESWWQSIADFVQASPLRLYALLNVWDNAFWCMDVYEQLCHRDTMLATMRERLADMPTQSREHHALARDIEHMQTHGRTSAILTAVAATCFGLSTLLAAIPPAHYEEADPSVRFSRLYANAATMVLQLPHKDRDCALEHMAEFLSRQEALSQAQLSAQDIREQIDMRTRIMESSPWVRAHRHTPDTVIAAWEVPATLRAAPQLRAA